MGADPFVRPACTPAWSGKAFGVCQLTAPHPREVPLQGIEARLMAHFSEDPGLMAGAWPETKGTQHPSGGGVVRPKS